MPSLSCSGCVNCERGSVGAGVRRSWSIPIQLDANLEKRHKPIMSRWLACVNGALIAGLLIFGPLWYYGLKSVQFRNLHVVRQGVLYRSGQMTLSGLKEVIRAQRIRTVISLRDSRRCPGSPPPDTAEENFCRSRGLNYLRLPPLAWDSPNEYVPADVNVGRFCEIMRDSANFPVLIHCMAGKHRTGAFCAVYRLEFEHWDLERALAEMVTYGYDTLNEHQDILKYLRQYKPTGKARANKAEPIRFQRETHYGKIE